MLSLQAGSTSSRLVQSQGQHRFNPLPSLLLLFPLRIQLDHHARSDSRFGNYFKITKPVKVYTFRVPSRDNACHTNSNAVEVILTDQPRSTGFAYGMCTPSLGMHQLHAAGFTYPASRTSNGGGTQAMYADPRMSVARCFMYCKHQCINQEHARLRLPRAELLQHEQTSDGLDESYRQPQPQPEVWKTKDQNG